MLILVTGVTGQIGGSLAGGLASFGTVITPDRAALDLARLESIPSFLNRLEPDLIVNSAAYTAVDEAEDQQGLAMIVNARAPGAIAQWAARHRVPLIHFSTDYVFDGSGERPWREDDETRPLSVYGSSKLAGEREVRAADGPHLILRTAWVYAARGRNFMRTIARLASERAELRIVTDQVGAPTSAAQITAAVCRILAARPENLPSQFARAHGVLHLTASGEASWYEFACAIVAGLRERGAQLTVEQIIPIRSEEYPTRAARPKNSRLDLGRLEQVFGIRMSHWINGLAPELDLLTS
jgi:dTDP-4-dehydrorhamnose reductase